MPSLLCMMRTSQFEGRSCRTVQHESDSSQRRSLSNLVSNELSVDLFIATEPGQFLGSTLRLDCESSNFVVGNTELELLQVTLRKSKP